MYQNMKRMISLLLAFIMAMGMAVCIPAQEIEPAAVAGENAVGDWAVVDEDEKTYDVGGMPVSIVASLIVGSTVIKTTGSVKAAIASAVASAVVAVILGAEFPLDYKITVTYLKEIRIVDPGPLPVVVEYHENVGVYGGPSDDLYETTFHEYDDTWTEEAWTRSPLLAE